ncbi:hypothetical protein KQI52_01045 [bacterium]|nr:hypothetical protein [bacterium]
MHLIAVGELKEGDVLGRTQFDNDGLIIAPAGFRLQKKHLSRLAELSAGRVPVMDLGEEAVYPGMIIREIVARNIDLSLSMSEQPKPETVTKYWADNALTDALVKHPAREGSTLDNTTLSKLQDILIEAAHQQVTTLISMPKVPPDPWIEFGVRCASLSLILAHEFNYPVRDMAAVASAALIHFIGRTVFESYAIEETSQTDLEKVVAREHPTFASMIVRGSNPEADLENQIILQQEERYSGRGFPSGLKGADQPPRPQRRLSPSTMLPQAELVNTAIGFERLRKDPVTELSCDLLTCVEQMAAGNEQVYNTYAMETLCLMLQRFPIGSRVKIKSNSTGRYLGFSGIVRRASEHGGGALVKEIYLTHDPQGLEIDPIHANFNDEGQMHLLWH